MSSAHNDDPFSCERILDDTSPGPFVELPDISHVPEFVDIETRPTTNFTFLDIEDAPMGTMEPQPTQPSQPSQVDRNPFHVHGYNQNNYSMVVDANSGGAHDLQHDNGIPEDLRMVNTNGAREQGLEHTVPLETPTCDATHEQVAVAAGDAEVHQEHVDNGASGNFQMGEVETLENDMPLKSRRTKKRKRHHQSEETTANTFIRPDSAVVQTWNTGTHTSDVTTPTSVTPVVLTQPMARAHNHASQDIVAQHNGAHATDHTQVGIASTQTEIPPQPSATNVTAAQRATPHTAGDRMPNARLSPLDLNTPFAADTPLQHNTASWGAHVIPPTSPLGMLPGRMRDMLMVRARHQSYAGAETRALQIAQNAAITIHRMAQNGQLPPTIVTSRTPIPTRGQASTPGLAPNNTTSTPRMRRTCSENASRAQSSATLPSQSPSPQIAAAYSQSQAMGIQNIPPSTMPGTPVLSKVKQQPSIEIHLSRVSSADFQSLHTGVPQHPLTPTPLRHMQQALYPDLQLNTNQTQIELNTPPTPVTPAHPNHEVVTDHPNHSAPPLYVQYPANPMVAPTGLNQGAGPSSLRVTEREEQAAEATAQALSATYNQLCDIPQTNAPQSLQAQRWAAQQRDGPKLRFSKNANPSTFCHICGRCSKTVTVFECSNVPIGLCRKVLCEKCVIIYDKETLECARQNGMTWLCTHCRNKCPEKARCFQYKRNNEKRRQKNEAKKREKREREEQEAAGAAEAAEAAEEQEAKRRRGNDDRGDDPGASPTGISDCVF